MKDLKDKVKQVQAKDPIKQILDDNDLDNVILYDANNRPIEFEQIARIQLDDYEGVFVILIPITKMPGVEEGEGVVFKLDATNGTLDNVEDQTIIDKVLEAYMSATGEDADK